MLSVNIYIHLSAAEIASSFQTEMAKVLFLLLLKEEPGTVHYDLEESHVLQSSF